MAQPMRVVMRPARILRKITTAFAEAVAAGDLDAAEGWFRLARMTAERMGGTGPVAPAEPVGRSEAPIVIA
jgi:iron uptake system EfeUOB component EfeO/EfeM